MTRPALMAYPYRMAQRQIRPPKPLPLPSTLPFENQTDRLLSKLASTLEGTRFTKIMRALEARAPAIESIDFPTPFGKVRTPGLTLPVPVPPAMDQRRKEILKAALADDLAGLVEKIPFVGAFASPLADAAEDTFMAKLQDLLTPEEWSIFKEQDKVLPLTSAAALVTFTKTRSP